MSISKLPFEITERITSYLDKEDFLQCMCVSFSWNINIRPFHYRSVKLGDERKRLAFFESLERSVKRVKTDQPATPRIDDLGHYVHTLDMRESFMSVADTQKLARLCPNVKAVHFRWEEFSDASIFFGSQKRVYHSPTSFFDHFHPSSLTALELTVTIPPQSLYAVLNTPSHSSKISFVLLDRFPQLQSLKLNCELDLEIAHLEHIHTICPKLKRLKVSKPRLADCSIPGIIAPARTVQHLVLPSREWNHPRVCECIWFKYIIHKYPALKTLNIACTEMYLRNTDQESMLPSEEITSITLQNHFLHLERLCLGRFSGRPSTTWPQLIKGVPNIELHDDDAPNTFSNWIKSDVTTGITCLLLHTIPKCLGEISHITNLRKLYLGYDSVLDSNQKVPLDIILSQCPALEIVRLLSCMVAYDDFTTVVKSPLHTLMVSRSVLQDNNVLLRVGEQCPHLRHLQLHYCHWFIETEYPVIRIHMPQQWFTFIRLVQPRICKQLAVSSRMEFSQDQYGMHHISGSNEYLMVTTAPPESTGQSLYRVRRTKIASTLARVYDTEIAHWLDQRDFGKDIPDSLTRKQDRSFHSMRLEKRWSTTVSCRGIDRLYYNSVRVDINDTRFDRNVPNKFKQLDTIINQE